MKLILRAARAYCKRQPQTKRPARNSNRLGTTEEMRGVGDEGLEPPTSSV